MERFVAEARFLRAFFHWELVKRYGGIPIITRVFDINEDFSGVNRNTLQECIDFIISECDEVADLLPNTWPQGEYFGKATKGAALALKSRVSLYAASELYNNPSWAAGYANPELISLTGDRTAKWQAAADAAREVIDLGLYSLSDNYRGLFRTFSSAEIIFTRRDNQRNDFERANFSIGFNGGRSGTTPSQNLVDAFEMANGTPFDWNNPTHAANPYENRDPRLHLSILTNHREFRDRRIQTFNGGLDGPPIERATRTGYYILKYIDEGTQLQAQNETSAVHSWIYMRLAEIYLNYAEALNEVSPGHPDIKEFYDRVRQRPGVNMPPLPIGLPQNIVRERIRNERRVELAFEDHRLWDTRRWMIAGNTLGAPLRGVNVERVTDSTFNYQPRVVESRAWEPKMYFYPIPQNEILRAGDWEQNPLW